MAITNCSYDKFTDEILKQWKDFASKGGEKDDKKAKKEKKEKYNPLLDIMKPALTKANEQEDVEEWSQLCLELVWRVVNNGRWAVKATVSTFQDLGPGPADEEEEKMDTEEEKEAKEGEKKKEDQFVLEGGAAEVLVDSLWAVGMQISRGLGKSEDQSEWVNLADLTASLAAAQVLDPYAMKCSLEEDLLGASGLVRDVQSFNKRIKKLNTDLVYRQQKYNLLHEETEGWSKFVVLVSNLPPTKEQAVAKLLSLIGYFDLDPNRALDLLLSLLEKEVEVGLTQQLLEVYMALINQFRASALPHILGFKFTQFQGADTPSTPASLYALTVVLLATGMLKLEGLLPHLTPTLPQMTQAQVDLDKKRTDQAKAFGVIKLSTLKEDKQEDEDDGKQWSLVDTDLGDSVKENQLIGLVAAALDLRLWGLAQDLLDKLEQQGIEGPLYPKLRQALCRMCHWVLDGVHKASVPFGALDLGLPAPKDEAQPLAKAREALAGIPLAGGTGLGARLSPPTDKAKADLVGLVEPLLLRLGIHLHRDVPLLVKVMRVFKAVVPTLGDLGMEGPQTAVQKRFLRLLEIVVFPSLSFLGANAGASYEAWDLLTTLPYTWRFDVYNAWQGEGLEKDGLGFKHLEVTMVEMRAGQRCRAVLKRLAKENIKLIGRQLAKVAHCNPHVVFKCILGQIEAYDNLIQPVIDSFKFMTPLALDVASFSLVNQLSSSRSKLKDDGIFISKWLASLANFTGVLYRKFPTTELQGLLHFLCNRLRGNHSLDLVVLQELLTKMGGVDLALDMSEKQVEGQAGGETLRSETTTFGIKDKVSKRATNQLRDTLFQSGTALPLLVLIAQQRQMIVFKTESHHLKVIGNLYDTCSMVLSSLSAFLSCTKQTLQRYLAMLPPLSVLCSDMGLQPALAFMLARPLIREALAKGSAEKAGAYASWYPFSSEFLEQVREMLPESAWVSLTPSMFTMFWVHNLYDIFVPKQTYKGEITRLKNQIRQLQDEASNLQRQSEQGNYSQFSASRVNPSEAAQEASKKRKEADRLQGTLDALEKEQQVQQEHTRQVLERFEEMKGSLQSSIKPEHLKGTVDAMIAHCAFPRLILEHADSLYTSKFFHLLHRLGTPNFSSLQYYDRMAKDIIPTVYCITEREASFLGIFLRDTLQVLKRWRFDQEAFEQEAQSKCGFSTNFVSVDDDRATYFDYCRVFGKWNNKIARVFLNCLASQEFMEVRCTLIILSNIVQVFPIRKRVGMCILAKLNPLKEDKRQDVKVMANRYWALLERQKQHMWEDDQLVIKPPSSKSASDSKEDSSGKKRKLEEDGNDKGDQESSKGKSSKSGSKRQKA